MKSRLPSGISGLRGQGPGTLGSAARPPGRGGLGRRGLPWS